MARLLYPNQKRLWFIARKFLEGHRAAGGKRRASRTMWRVCVSICRPWLFSKKGGAY